VPVFFLRSKGTEHIVLERFDFKTNEWTKTRECLPVLHCMRNITGLKVR